MDQTNARTEQFHLILLDSEHFHLIPTGQNQSDFLILSIRSEMLGKRHRHIIITTTAYIALKYGSWISINQ